MLVEFRKTRIMRKSNKAMTLAEVLITLGIIGVVAALTIPVLINIYTERQFVSKAKKTYSLMSNVVSQWQADNGCVGNSLDCGSMGTLPSQPHKADVIAKEFMQYLQVVDSAIPVNSGTALNVSDVGWIPEKGYSINGALKAGDVTSPEIGRNQDSSGYGAFLLLKDGTVVKIAGTWRRYLISFDVNGAKPPNRMGKDQFTSSLYTNNHPSYNPYAGNGTWPQNGLCEEPPTEYPTTTTECTAEGNSTMGYSPMAYVLKYDKLLDLKALGYPVSP